MDIDTYILIGEAVFYIISCIKPCIITLSYTKDLQNE